MKVALDTNVLAYAEGVNDDGKRGVALELVRGEFDARNWRAFWLTVIEGRAPAALAAELNMTANHIRQVKSRVLRRLREEVGDLLD